MIGSIRAGLSVSIGRLVVGVLSWVVRFCACGTTFIDRVRSARKK